MKLVINMTEFGSITFNEKKYDREFKQNAVELSFARGNAREIA